jgi:hypothetical protein
MEDCGLHGPSQPTVWRHRSRVAPRRLNQVTRLLTLAGLAALALLAACDGGGISQDSAATPRYVVTIGPEGGRIEVPASDEVIGGVGLSVPGDALAAEAEVSIQAKPSDAETPRQAAEREPELELALVKYALDNVDTGLMHPLWGPIFGLSSAEFAGPGLLLGPEGQEFATPVELEMPLETLGIDDPETALPLLRNDDGSWEVIEDFSVDEAKGIATVRVPHFSLMRWLRNLVSAPGQTAVVFASGAVQQARDRLPQDTFELFVQGAVCSGQEPSANLRNIPGLPTLLDYLGFEHGAVRTGQENSLKTWITDQFQEARAGNAQFNSISLADIFRKAMELNGGDVFQALVTAHNVLRDNRDSPSVQQMIENYRGDGGDERGARYHLFGMTLYSFAYEYFLERTNIARESGQLVIGTEALDPRVTATIEESIVSGDILTDVTEYAVDLQGAELGRQLYRQVRNAQTADLVSKFGVDTSACDQPIGGGGWAVYRITNYGSAEGGYLTVAEVGFEDDPPLLSSYPGGGIDPDLRVEAERVDASATFPSPEAAAQSLCGQLTDFFRPPLASFILEAKYNGVNTGVDTIFQAQCE